MENKFKEMCNIPDQILAVLQKDIAEIKLALLGNEYNPTAGIVYRMQQVEIENEKLKARLDRIIAWAAGAAAVLTVTLNVLWEWFKNSILG